jgi:hypothetical protein
MHLDCRKMTPLCRSTSSLYLDVWGFILVLLPEDLSSPTDPASAAEVEERLDFLLFIADGVGGGAIRFLFAIASTGNSLTLSPQGNAGRADLALLCEI